MLIQLYGSCPPLLNAVNKRAVNKLTAPCLLIFNPNYCAGDTSFDLSAFIPFICCS